MKRVYISGATRTPLGTYQGTLAAFSEQKMAAMTMLALIKDTDIDPNIIDEIILGNSKQTSTPSNMARHAQLEAELPVEIPAYTVQRQSASGLQAVVNGYLAIKSGNAEVILAGGSESMSRIPLEIRNARFAFGAGTEMIFDPIANQLAGAQPARQYGKADADAIAQVISRQFGISQQEINDYIESSSQKRENAGTKNHLLPIEIKKKKLVEMVMTDQLYEEAAAIAKPADGAAVCLLCSEDSVKEHNLPIKGEVLAVAFDADNPRCRGYIADRAVTSALKKANLKLTDLDFIEISEFSAAQILATHKVLRDLGMSQEEVESKVNTEGGTLLCGLSWGAVGAVLLTDLVYKLQAGGKKYGMVIAPAEGGQTLVVILEAK